MARAGIHSTVFFSILLLVAATAGCQNQQMQPSYGQGPAHPTAEGVPLNPPPGSISVYQLAGQLGMEVRQSSSALATLGDGRNCIRIFPGRHETARVNGQPAGHRSSVVAIGRMLFVPAEWASSIASRIRHSRRARAPRPAPRPEVPTRIGHPRALDGLVVIDAGHGGDDPGAIGVNKLQEKDFNLRVAHRVAERLGALGLSVRMTRRDDRFIELDDRAEFANRLKADLFVSIHANAVGSRTDVVHGYQVYVARSASEESLTAAELLAGRLDAADIPCWGKQPCRSDFRVLVGTSGPAMLIESGFLTHPTEARKLASDNYQRQLGDLFAEGIADFFRQQ